MLLTGNQEFTDSQVLKVFNIWKNRKMEIFNIKGQIINTLADGLFNKGSHSIFWNGTNQKGESVTSGIYFCRVKSSTENYCRKMIIINE